MTTTTILTAAWSPFVPVHDAEDDADDWRDDLGAAEGDLLRALYATWTETESRTVGLGHGLFREIEHECTLHRLIGVTAENVDERLFLDREAVMALVGEAAVNAAEDRMDERENW